MGYCYLRLPRPFLIALETPVSITAFRSSPIILLIPVAAFSCTFKGLQILLFVTLDFHVAGPMKHKPDIIRIIELIQKRALVGHTSWAGVDGWTFMLTPRILYNINSLAARWTI